MRFRHSFILALAFLTLFASCAVSPKIQEGWEGPITRVIAQSKRPDYETVATLGRGADAYKVLVHSPLIRPRLRAQYTASEMAGLRKALAKTLAFNLDARGLVRAADRVEPGAPDPTHYDAVRVRDNLWVYLALRENPAERALAKRTLLTLADYFASPAQAARFEGVIDNRAMLITSEGGMSVPHVRFDGRSPEFLDVLDGASAQMWNHKQNDVLGLFLDLFCRALLEREITRKDLTPARVAMIGRFPRYFKAVKFESMVDAGTWEEIERVNTSSVALVVSGLERLDRAKRFFPKIQMKPVYTLIDKGYDTIRRQLAAGGESPGYRKGDVRRREGDAALLGLIFPAKLSRLKRSDYETVLKVVAPLVGAAGIKRYSGDSYQSSGFWFEKPAFDDVSSEAAFTERGTRFKPGTEAQWFFDSWYAVALRTLGKRYGDRSFELESTKYLNRALGQVTGGERGAPLIGADGNPVAAMSVPESYNTAVDTAGDRCFVPSPITPMNWAKASLRLALGAP